MHKLSAAAACAAFVLASAVPAMAGSMGNGAAQRAAAAKAAGHTVNVGLGPEGQRVMVTIAGTSFAYNPANGSVNQMPTPAENLNPVQGVGVVVKRNPGSSAARVTGNGNGTWAIDPSTLTAGNYDIVVTVQAHAVNTKGTGGVQGRMASSDASASASATATLPAKTTNVTFHVTVDAKGNMRIDPSMAPTATAAASGTAAQQ